MDPCAEGVVDSGDHTHEKGNSSFDNAHPGPCNTHNAPEPCKKSDAVGASDSESSEPEDASRASTKEGVDSVRVVEVLVKATHGPLAMHTRRESNAAKSVVNTPEEPSMRIKSRG